MTNFEKKRQASKRYLERLLMFKEIEEEEKRHLAEVRATLTSLGSFDYSKDIVDTSPQGDGMTNAIQRLIEQEQKVLEAYTNYCNIRRVITGQIEAIPNAMQATVLYLYYVQGSRIRSIAKEISYSEDRTYHIYEDALDSFYSLHLDKK